MQNNIIILEGLPGVGKTCLAKNISKQYAAKLIPEIMPSISDEFDMKRITDQKIFVMNDTLKKEEANNFNGLSVIDRGALSTISYSITKNILNSGYNFEETKDWFIKEWLPFYKQSGTITLYLRGRSSPWHVNPLDPYGTQDNLKLLEKVTTSTLRLYGIKHYIVEYDYADKKSLLEISDLIDKT